MSAVQGSRTAATALSRVSSATAGTAAQGGAATRAPAAPVTAQQIAADQAAVAADQAELSVAQQNLATAQLTTPMGGQVAEVSLTPGTQVSANSATAQIMVIKPGADEVTLGLTASQLSSVRVGQPASVLPDGASRALPGAVSRIGLLPSTTSGSPTYPVTVSLDGSAPASLFAGAGATVTITEARAAGVVAVPSSAVHRVANRYKVTLLKGGQPDPVIVKVGAVGPVLTQIVSGVAAGEQVELADLNAPLPSGSVTTGIAARLARTAGGGAFGSGGPGAGTGGAGGFRGGG
jgi:multidrug efflux pump subunit AcrA (membrane-fusion protein)